MGRLSDETTEYKIIKIQMDELEAEIRSDSVALQAKEKKMADLARSLKTSESGIVAAAIEESDK